MLIQIHIKADQKKFVLALLEMGLASLVMGLKLTVSQEWIDGIHWFFAGWCKFRNSESYFTDFWVGKVKNGCGHLFSLQGCKICCILRMSVWR